MKSDQEGFHGGSVVKNPPANAGDMGSIPGPGGSHVRSPHTPTREKPMQQQRPSTAKNKFFFFKKSDQERSADSDGGRQCRLTHTCMHTCTHTCTHVCTHTPRSVNRVQCSLTQRLSAATRGARGGGQALCGQAAVLTAPPAMEPLTKERHHLEVLAVHHVLGVG